MKDDSGYDRTFKRYRVDFPMFARPVAGGTDLSAPAQPVPEDRAGGLPGLAHNVSLSGVGFLCGGSFELGSLVEIEITLEAQTFSLHAGICWRRRLDLPGDSLYYHGAKFLRTEAVLQFIPVAAQFLIAQDCDRLARRERGIRLAMSAGRQQG